MDVSNAGPRTAIIERMSLFVLLIPMEQHFNALVAELFFQLFSGLSRKLRLFDAEATIGHYAC